MISSKVIYKWEHLTPSKWNVIKWCNKHAANSNLFIYLLSHWSLFIFYWKTRLKTDFFCSVVKLFPPSGVNLALHKEQIHSHDDCVSWWVEQTDGKWLFLEQLECVRAVPVVFPVSAALAAACSIEHIQQIMTTCLHIPVVQTVVQGEIIIGNTCAHANSMPNCSPFPVS